MLFFDEHRVREVADALAARIHGWSADYLPIDESDYPPSVLAPLTRQHRALEEQGFRALGDFEVTQLYLRTHGVHQLARLFTSADGRAYAALVCTAISIDDSMAVHEDALLEFVSELDDGRFVYTLESSGEERVLEPPTFEQTPRPVGTEVAELWRLHRERLTNEAPVIVRDFDGLLASQKREAELRRTHAISLAERGLTRAQVRALGGPNNVVLAHRVARQLRRRVGRPGAF